MVLKWYYFLVQSCTQINMAADKPEVVMILGHEQIEMWFQMLLPCFQGSPSQCNIDFPVISSKYIRNSIWRPDIDEMTWRSMLHCDGDPWKHDRGTWNHIFICYRSKVITTSGLAADIFNCLYVSSLWVLKNVTSSVWSSELLKTAWEYDASLHFYMV